MRSSRALKDTRAELPTLFGFNGGSRETRARISKKKRSQRPRVVATEESPSCGAFVQQPQYSDDRQRIPIQTDRQPHPSVWRARNRSSPKQVSHRQSANRATDHYA